MAKIAPKGRYYFYVIVFSFHQNKKINTGAPWQKFESQKMSENKYPTTGTRPPKAAEFFRHLWILCAISRWEIDKVNRAEGAANFLKISTPWNQGELRSQKMNENKYPTGLALRFEKMTLKGGVLILNSAVSRNSKFVIFRFWWFFPLKC